MKRGADWYKRDPIAFLDGVQGLGPDLIGAYAVILDLLYARAGESRRDDRHLAGLLGCSSRKAAALTDALIDAGKITVHDGFIVNSRVENDVKQWRDLCETRAKHGRTGGEKSAATRKINTLAEANASSEIQADKRREEKKEENVKSETAVSDSARPSRKKGLQKYPEAFERLWRMWEPRRPNQSKAAAFEEWRKFDDAHRKAIEIGSEPYFAACQREEIALLHLERFIRKRRFEAFAEVCDEDGEAEGDEEHGQQGNGRADPVRDVPGQPSEERRGRDQNGGGDHPGDAGVDGVDDLFRGAGHRNEPHASSGQGGGSVEHVLGSEPVAAGAPMGWRAVPGERSAALPQRPQCEAVREEGVFREHDAGGAPEGYGWLASIH